MKIRIGTRKSKLALAQTKLVADALKSEFPDVETEIVHITTKGDKILDKPLAEIGGKGLFISEIENALLDGTIDIAVHSAKDLPVKLADGLEIPCVLERADVRDCLIVRNGETFAEADKFCIGTGSFRRRMSAKKYYPNAEFKDIRGNVDTRINKLINHEYDGIILAKAGLDRLGIASDERINILPFDADFLSAPCQAIIAVECIKKSEVSQYLEKINDTKSFYAFETERKIIEKIGGDCGIPLGVYTEISDEKIMIKISVNSERTASGTADISDRIMLAERLVNEL